MRLTPTRAALRKRKRSKYVSGRSSRTNSMSVSSREVSEKSVTEEVPTKIRCINKDKEGANEYARSASKKRVGFKFKYEDLQNMIAPAWAENYTAQSRQYEVAVNTEKLLEHLFLDVGYVKQRILKSPDIDLDSCIKGMSARNDAFLFLPLIIRDLTFICFKLFLPF